MKTPWVLGISLLFSSTANAVTLAQICQSNKNKEAGKYEGCRQKAEAKFATTVDPVRRTTDLAKCLTKVQLKWSAIEAKAGGACPSNGDQASIQSVIDVHTDNVATALAGGPLQDCPADLAACLAAPQGQRLQTGQTTCFDGAGASIPCAGTGHDGDLQEGLVVGYVDNGDGTITDQRTGLMWEKLSDDGSIHDQDDTYTWEDAFSVKIAALNGASFAGHADWRLPNVNEMQSLVRYGATSPAIDAAFDAACAPACTVTTCSCTLSNNYWTSTTYLGFPSVAWFVSFFDGDLTPNIKTDPFYVRAVRTAP